MRGYWNTNEEEGETLERSSQKALTQEDRVLAIFNRFRHRDGFTPEEILSIYILDYPGTERTPITSIRRAITNLSSDGDLERTERMRMGRLGKAVHIWRLRKPINKQEELFGEDGS